VQRILSLATLVVLGGLGWTFLREGQATRPVAAPAVDGGTFPGANPWTASGGLGPAPAGPPSTAAAPAAVGAPTQYASVPGNGSWPPPPSGPAIRIASYNIQAFGPSKADKPHILYTLAEIVRQFDVVAIQEVRTQDDYHIPNFVRLVNQTGRRYDHIVGPRLGNTTSTEQYAFLFDADRIEADFSNYYTVRDPDNLLHREPLVASFRVRGIPPEEAFTFTLVNVHADPDVVDAEIEALAEAYRVVRLAGRDEDDVIMLGDFNADDRHLGRIAQIPGVKPLISGAFTNTRQNRLYDNLVIHQPSTTEYLGRSGVFDVMRQFNLTMDQALQVSDHLPVWAEFSAYERDYAGRIARRGMPVRY
jgi:endonuclease/exonuclease/phosphatase family metal-dependent hydrolase